MKTFLSMLAALTLAGASLAQAGDAVAAARSDYQKFQSDWFAEQAAARASLQTILDGDQYDAARSAQDQKTMRELVDQAKKADTVGFARRALELADKHGRNGAIFLAFVASSVADKDIGHEVVKRIEGDLLDAPELATVLESPYSLQAALGPQETKALLDHILAGSKQAAPRAWAFYWRSYLVKRDRKATDEQKAQAAEDMKAATALAEGTLLGERLAAPEFAKQHLQIGMVAPDIAGEDVDGVPFKLSDYRGKVVVLDFWGFW